MTDDEHALQTLLQHAAEEFDALDGPALRDATERRKKRRLRLVALPAVAAAAVAGIAVAGVLVGHRGASPDRSTDGTPPTGSVHSPTSGPSATTDGSFRVRLVLSGTSFPADGQPIRAYVLAINHTGRPVVISDACDGWLEAGLTGKHATFDILNGAVACANKNLKPGTTRFPVIIASTFATCLQGRQPGTATAPHCLPPHDSRSPNLPAGTYRAEVKTMSLSVRPVLSKPQLITLTPVH